MSNPRYLEMRSADARLFDVYLADLLDDNEFATACAQPTTDGDAPASPGPAVTQLTFSTVVVNASPIYYPRWNVTADPGKAVQTRIALGPQGGLAGASERYYTLRFRLTTSQGNTIEATVLLRLSDKAD